MPRWQQCAGEQAHELIDLMNEWQELYKAGKTEETWMGWFCTAAWRGLIRKANLASQVLGWSARMNKANTTVAITAWSSASTLNWPGYRLRC